MTFDIAQVPFSRFGCYTAFSSLEPGRHCPKDLPAGVWMRDVHGDAGREVFRLVPLRGGQPLPYRVEAGPSELRLACDGGRVRVAILADETVRFRAEGVGLRLEMRRSGANCAVREGGGAWRIVGATSWRNYRAVPLRGTLAVDAPWTVQRCEHVHMDLAPDAAGAGELALEQFVAHEPPRVHAGAFDDEVAACAAAFERFAAPHLGGRAAAEWRDAVRLAAYVQWSAVVSPRGFFTRPAMLMSKNWMTNVWSWDHAFNAWALAAAHPDLAWDQFMLPFDHQHPSGQLPDFVNDVLRQYNFVKPPVHGWILRRMLALTDRFGRDRLAEAYEPLARWARWWLDVRTPDGLPQYHHGFDSGWDNATVFDPGFPSRGPELAAFLAAHLEALGELAGRLGRPAAEADAWRARAAAMREALCARLWRGGRFVTERADTGAVNGRSDSVFRCLPVVLGALLPAAIRDALAREVPRHLTEWGPATERPDSPLYEPDGYWRGPIWAPPTMVLVDGLRAAGRAELADDIARRFCRLCARGGFAECFDAVTGEPRRDRAYTWTASVFLLLSSATAAGHPA